MINPHCHMEVLLAKGTKAFLQQSHAMDSVCGILVHKVLDQVLAETNVSEASIGPPLYSIV